MGIAICEDCRETFAPARLPRCPACLVGLWLSSTSLVRAKHDPRELPLAWPGYRSVLSPGFVADPRPTLDYAAHHGRWFWDLHYDMFVHLTFEPLGRAAGAGIPEGARMPEHALDSLLIVEADSPEEAHAFAVQRETFEAQVRAGEFEPLAVCEADDCENLRIPRRHRCIVHAHPTTSTDGDAHEEPSRP